MWMSEPSVWLEHGRWVVIFWVLAFILFLIFPFQILERKPTYKKRERKMDIHELDDIEEFLAVEVTQDEEDSD